MTRVVAHDPGWTDAFAKEAAAITRALRDQPMSLHHIGSTAIPGILAKPIIDLLGDVPSLSAFDANSALLEVLGYEAMGAYGIPGRRYFRKTDTTGRRTHHLHIFETGSPHIERHLAFRDYLKVHPAIAAAYSALKAELTRDGPLSWERYHDGKDPFVAATEAQAIAWYRRRCGPRR